MIIEKREQLRKNVVSEAEKGDEVLDGGVVSHTAASTSLERRSTDPDSPTEQSRLEGKDDNPLPMEPERK